ncbi:TfuA-like protein [Niveispirillum irakense]|uniref:TfuA-like protein n=1 Tax=Niveispirillum irakense TaxID=34011 RepID=UPI000415D7A9|nr:TfuA-like protein [Niveispirillum irakense]
MSNQVIVFLGPTLPVSEARRVLEADYRPPVAQGDVLRAVTEQPAAIAIIDGYFANMPSVWHKEILFALHRGIPVLGAASMGALRAAELHSFGMTGIGDIFAAYLDGRLEDDDEVAIIHGPGEIGYPMLSEAMVNIRRTLSDAFAAGIITAYQRQQLQRIAKDLPYRERSFGRVFREAVEEGAGAAELERLRVWIAEGGHVDQKRLDALALLAHIRDGMAMGSLKVTPSFAFEHTFNWDRVAQPVLSVPV